MTYTDIKTKYCEAYYNLTFGDGFLLGINGVQTALYMQGYDKKTENANMDDIYYGYFDSTTEKMIKAFQTENDLEPTGKLDEETWNAIYDGLARTKGVMLAITGEKELTIIDIDKMLDNEGTTKQYILDGRQNFDDAEEKKYITANGKINFVDSGELTTESDTLGGQTFNDNLSKHITEIGNKTLEAMYNDEYGNGSDGNTNEWHGSHVLDGRQYYDDLKYEHNNYGEQSLTPGYYVNMPNSNRWNGTKISDVDTGTYQRDYDFIYNLLTNTVYNPGGYVNPMKKSNSTLQSIIDYTGDFEESTNKPFFDVQNLLTFRRTKFDIDLVYGAKGLKSRKIKCVVPMSLSQQVDASGEPIYDLIEFVAQDVVYSDNNDTDLDTNN